MNGSLKRTGRMRERDIPKRRIELAKERDVKMVIVMVVLRRGDRAKGFWGPF